MKEYLVPTGDGEAQFIERRSRFIGHIFLTETEIDNLISIIEGIRYQVPADGIRNLLIYSD